MSIVPGGIVVKEGVFAFLFKRIVPVSFAIMCAILIRLFTLLTEVLITVVFFLLDRGAWQNLLEFRKSSPELRTESDDEKTD